jgi:hypothetical protein
MHKFFKKSGKYSHFDGAARLRKGSKRKCMVAGGAVLAFSILSVGAGNGALLTAAESIGATISGRSPGARASGDLVKIKKSGDEVSTALALSRVRTQSSAPKAAVVVPLDRSSEVSRLPSVSNGLSGLESPLSSDALGPTLSSGMSNGGGVIGSLPGGAVMGGISGGGGGGGGGFSGGGRGGDSLPPASGTVRPPDSGVVSPPVEVVSAVPEPATWMTMILGFGAIGVALRRSRRRLAETSPLLRGRPNRSGRVQGS